MRFLCLTAAVALLPAQTAELAQEIIANELRQFRDLGEFTFSYELRHRFYGPGRRLEREYSESGESYMSGRRNVDIALTRNGKPLRPKDLGKVRRAAIAKLEADASARLAGGGDSPTLEGRPGPGMQRNKARMSAIDVLRYCQLREMPAEGGLIPIVFGQCRSPWEVEAHYAHLRGTIWVDRAAKVVDRWRAWITDGPSPGELLYEQTTQRTAGGMRVLALNHLDLSAAPHLFPDDTVATEYRWTNPQRFRVDVNQTIGEPKP